MVFFNTLKGMTETSPAYLRRAKMMGASQLQTLVHVTAPSALSWLFGALRVAVGFAIIGAVIGEYLDSSAGVGFIIAEAEANFDATGIIAGLVILMVLVAGIDVAMQALEQRYSQWRPQKSDQ